MSMDKCKHKWILQNAQMACRHCDKLNNDKCYRCQIDGLYTDFHDGKEVSVCFRHLADYTS